MPKGSHSVRLTTGRESGFADPASLPNRSKEAHDLGMVHRDVKPSKSFICRLGKRVISLSCLIFGLVKALQSPGHVRLTTQGGDEWDPTAFMAPEQVRSEADVDARVDIL